MNDLDDLEEKTLSRPSDSYRPSVAIHCVSTPWHHIWDGLSHKESQATHPKPVEQSTAVPNFQAGLVFTQNYLAISDFRSIISILIIVILYIFMFGAPIFVAFPWCSFHPLFTRDGSLVSQVTRATVGFELLLMTWNRSRISEISCFPIKDLHSLLPSTTNDLAMDAPMVTPLL